MYTKYIFYKTTPDRYFFKASVIAGSKFSISLPTTRPFLDSVIFQTLLKLLFSYSLTSPI